MRDALTTVGEVLGLGVVAVGVGMVCLPAGLIVGGLSMAFVCFMLGRKS